MFITQEFKQFLKLMASAFAKANGHPDPDAHADAVVQHFEDGAAQASADAVQQDSAQLQGEQTSVAQAHVAQPDVATQQANTAAVAQQLLAGDQGQANAAGLAQQLATEQPQAATADPLPSASTT